MKRLMVLVMVSMMAFAGCTAATANMDDDSTLRGVVFVDESDGDTVRKAYAPGEAVPDVEPDLEAAATRKAELEDPAPEDVSVEDGSPLVLDVEPEPEVTPSSALPFKAKQDKRPIVVKKGGTLNLQRTNVQIPDAMGVYRVDPDTGESLPWSEPVPASLPEKPPERSKCGAGCITGLALGGAAVAALVTTAVVLLLPKNTDVYMK